MMMMISTRKLSRKKIAFIGKNENNRQNKSFIDVIEYWNGKKNTHTLCLYSYSYKANNILKKTYRQERHLYFSYYKTFYIYGTQDGVFSTYVEYTVRCVPIILLFFFLISLKVINNEFGFSVDEENNNSSNKLKTDTDPSIYTITHGENICVIEN